MSDSLSTLLRETRERLAEIELDAINGRWREASNGIRYTGVLHDTMQAIIDQGEAELGGDW